MSYEQNIFPEEDSIVGEDFYSEFYIPYAKFDLVVLPRVCQGNSEIETSAPAIIGISRRCFEVKGPVDCPNRQKLHKSQRKRRNITAKINTLKSKQEERRLRLADELDLSGQIEGLDICSNPLITFSTPPEPTANADINSEKQIVRSKQHNMEVEMESKLWSEDVSAKTGGCLSEGGTPHAGDGANVPGAEEASLDEEDLIYQTAMEFARTHGYGLVEWEDDPPPADDMPTITPPASFKSFVRRLREAPGRRDAMSSRDRKMDTYAHTHLGIGDRPVPVRCFKSCRPQRWVRRRCLNHQSSLFNSIKKEATALESARDDIAAMMQLLENWDIDVPVTSKTKPKSKPKSPPPAHETPDPQTKEEDIIECKSLDDYKKLLSMKYENISETVTQSNSERDDVGTVQTEEEKPVKTRQSLSSNKKKIMGAGGKIADRRTHSKRSRSPNKKINQVSPKALNKTNSHNSKGDKSNPFNPETSYSSQHEKISNRRDCADESGDEELNSYLPTIKWSQFQNPEYRKQNGVAAALSRARSQVDEINDTKAEVTNSRLKRGMMEVVTITDESVTSVLQPTRSESPTKAVTQCKPKEKSSLGVAKNSDKVASWPNLVGRKSPVKSLIREASPRFCKQTCDQGDSNKKSGSTVIGDDSTFKNKELQEVPSPKEIKVNFANVNLKKKRSPVRTGCVSHTQQSRSSALKNTYDMKSNLNENKQLFSDNNHVREINTNIFNKAIENSLNISVYVENCINEAFELLFRDEIEKTLGCGYNLDCIKFLPSSGSNSSNNKFYANIRTEYDFEFPQIDNVQGSADCLNKSPNAFSEQYIESIEQFKNVNSNDFEVYVVEGGENSSIYAEVNINNSSNSHIDYYMFNISNNSLPDVTYAANRNTARNCAESEDKKDKKKVEFDDEFNNTPKLPPISPNGHRHLLHNTLEIHPCKSSESCESPSRSSIKISKSVREKANQRRIQLKNVFKKQQEFFDELHSDHELQEEEDDSVTIFCKRPPTGHSLHINNAESTACPKEQEYLPHLERPTTVKSSKSYVISQTKKREIESYNETTDETIGMDTNANILKITRYDNRQETEEPKKIQKCFDFVPTPHKSSKTPLFARKLTQKPGVREKIQINDSSGAINDISLHDLDCDESIENYNTVDLENFSNKNENNNSKLDDDEPEPEINIESASTPKDTEIVGSHSFEEKSDNSKVSFFEVYDESLNSNQSVHDVFVQQKDNLENFNLNAIITTTSEYNINMTDKHLDFVSNSDHSICRNNYRLEKNTRRKRYRLDQTTSSMCGPQTNNEFTKQDNVDLKKIQTNANVNARYGLPEGSGFSSMSVNEQSSPSQMRGKNLKEKQNTGVYLWSVNSDSRSAVKYHSKGPSYNLRYNYVNPRQGLYHLNAEQDYMTPELYHTITSVKSSEIISAMNNPHENSMELNVVSVDKQFNPRVEPINHLQRGCPYSPTTENYWETAQRASSNYTMKLADIWNLPSRTVDNIDLGNQEECMEEGVDSNTKHAKIYTDIQKRLTLTCEQLVYLDQKVGMVDLHLQEFRNQTSREINEKVRALKEYFETKLNSCYPFVNAENSHTIKTPMDKAKECNIRLCVSEERERLDSHCFELNVSKRGKKRKLSYGTCSDTLKEICAEHLPGEKCPTIQFTEVVSTPSNQHADYNQYSVESVIPKQASKSQNDKQRSESPHLNIENYDSVNQSIPQNESDDRCDSLPSEKQQIIMDGQKEKKDDAICANVPPLPFKRDQHKKFKTYRREEHSRSCRRRYGTAKLLNDRNAGKCNICLPTELYIPKQRKKDVQQNKIKRTKLITKNLKSKGKSTKQVKPKTKLTKTQKKISPKNKKEPKGKTKTAGLNGNRISKATAKRLGKNNSRRKQPANSLLISTKNRNSLKSKMISKKMNTLRKTKIIPKGKMINKKLKTLQLSQSSPTRAVKTNKSPKKQSRTKPLDSFHIHRQRLKRSKNKLCNSVFVNPPRNNIYSACQCHTDQSYLDPFGSKITLKDGKQDINIWDLGLEDDSPAADNTFFVVPKQLMNNIMTAFTFTKNATETNQKIYSSQWEEDLNKSLEKIAHGTRQYRSKSSMMSKSHQPTPRLPSVAFEDRQTASNFIITDSNEIRHCSSAPKLQSCIVLTSHDPSTEGCSQENGHVNGNHCKNQHTVSPSSSHQLLCNNSGWQRDIEISPASNREQVIVVNNEYVDLTSASASNKNSENECLIITPSNEMFQSCYSKHSLDTQPSLDKAVALTENSQNNIEKNNQSLLLPVFAISSSNCVTNPDRVKSLATLVREFCDQNCFLSDESSNKINDKDSIYGSGCHVSSKDSSVDDTMPFKRYFKVNNTHCAESTRQHGVCNNIIDKHSTNFLVGSIHKSDMFNNKMSESGSFQKDNVDDVGQSGEQHTHSKKQNETQDFDIIDTVPIVRTPGISTTWTVFTEKPNANKHNESKSFSERGGENVCFGLNKNHNKTVTTSTDVQNGMNNLINNNNETGSIIRHRNDNNTTPIGFSHGKANSGEYSIIPSSGILDVNTEIYLKSIDRFKRNENRNVSNSKACGSNPECSRYKPKHLTKHHNYLNSCLKTTEFEKVSVTSQSDLFSTFQTSTKERTAFNFGVKRSKSEGSIEISRVCHDQQNNFEQGMVTCPVLGSQASTCLTISTRDHSESNQSQSQDKTRLVTNGNSRKRPSAAAHPLEPKNKRPRRLCSYGKTKGYYNEKLLWRSHRLEKVGKRRDGDRSNWLGNA